MAKDYTNNLLNRGNGVSRRSLLRYLGIGTLVLGSSAVVGYQAWKNAENKPNPFRSKDEFQIFLTDKKVDVVNVATGYAQSKDCKFVGYAKFGDNWWDLYDATAQDPNAISLISRVSRDCNGKQVGRGVLNNDASQLFRYMRPLYDDKEPITLEQIAKEGGHQVFTVERFPNSISPEYKHIYRGKHYLVPVPHTGPPIDPL